MIYSEAISYIKNIERAGVDLGIERMRALLDLLGAPDRRLKVVHVAGTNGKGSVTAYLTSILREAGYTVGTYNSPSVFCYNERWLIDGAPLGDEQVAKYMSEVREVIERENLRAPFSPTAFEIETAVALLAFLDNSCDICVLEVGLGGRWDATNAIGSKLLSVITPIGLDHCAILGNTLGEIAAEKAAIIDGEAVTCAQCDQVMRQLRHPYAIVNGKKVPKKCRLTVCDAPKLICDSLDGQSFSYRGEDYDIKMLGEHQLVNASIAICAAETLDRLGFKVDKSAIKRGLAKAVWHGRFEVLDAQNNMYDISIPQDKTLVLDGAHNPHGAEVLKAAMQKYFGGKRVCLVMGVLGDKDVDGIVRILAPLATCAKAVTPPSPRALCADKLCQKISKYVPCTFDGALHNDIKKVVEEALGEDCDVVLLAGSLTLFEALGGNHG